MSATDKTAVNKIGNTNMGTTATTLTGAVSELNTNLNMLEDNLNTLDDNVVHIGGTEEITGIKAFDQIIYLKRNNATKSIAFQQYGTSNYVGSLAHYAGNATNVTDSYFYLRQFSPKTTADPATTGNYETYRLPSCTKGLTANKEYYIFNSKNLVKEVHTISFTTAAMNNKVSVASKTFNKSGYTPLYFSVIPGDYMDCVIGSYGNFAISGDNVTTGLMTFRTIATEGASQTANLKLVVLYYLKD